MFKKWFLLTNQSYTWYHISTHGINHTRRWFHKWSSTLSDHQMKIASLTYKSTILSSEWPMLWHRGRCPSNWYQGQRSYMWYLKSYTSGVIPIFGSVHKKCKIQASTIYPNASLCINEKHTFYGNWWQRGRDWDVQRYESFGRNWDKEVEVGHGYGQRRGSNIEKLRRIKILGQEKHTSREEQAHELLIDCIWYVHIHVLACIA